MDIERITSTKINNIFNIRYVKLHFYLEMAQDCVLPSFKTSALRGGIGEMLLRQNCIRDRDCKKCDFETECIVRRIMYSRFEIQPAFATEGDSVGYVLECDDYREEFPAGSELRFQLILFGKSIVYFSQYLQAVYALGQNGLGKDSARFGIARITNSRGRDILDGFNVNMKNYTIEKLSTYMHYRLSQIDQLSGELGLRFYTPLTQKYKGDFLISFNMEAILKSIQRRVYLMDCFEGIDGTEEYRKDLPCPEILRQTTVGKKNIRYSSRQNQKMPLKGISGEIWMKSVPEECLPYLAAGELLHIGKNTSFGYGKYRIVC